MKVAFILGKFPSVSQTFILNQITGLIDLGCDLDIYAELPEAKSVVHSDVENYQLLDRVYYGIPFTSSDRIGFYGKAKAIAENYTAHPLTLIQAFHIRGYGKQAKVLEAFYNLVGRKHLPHKDYDVIHCHFGWNGLKGHLFRKIGALGGKLVVTFHGADLVREINQENCCLYKRLFDDCDLVLPVSELWKKRLIELGCNEKKIYVHGMGVDCSKFKPISPEANKDRLTLVSVNRLIEKKGIEYAIRAVAIVANEGYQIEYLIVGNGPLYSELEQLIGTLGVNRIVKLLGWKNQDDVTQILARSDVFVAPSVTSEDGDMEGIPVSIMEAMGRGLPILSTHHSGIPELVEDGISGFLAPERDMNALAHYIKALIEQPGLRVQLGQDAAGRVRQKHDIDLLNKELYGTYQKLVSGELFHG